MKLKVLHIYKTFYPDSNGGVEEVIRQVCLSSAEYGIESRVFSLSPDPFPATISKDGVVVYRAKSFLAPASCDIGGLGSVLLFMKLAQWADVLHFHFPWPFFDFLNLFSKTNKPKIVTYHSDIVRQKNLGLLYRPLMMNTLGKMDSIIATSSNYQETSHILKSPAFEKKIKIIPIGVADVHGSFQKVDSILSKFDLKNNNFFLYLGVLRYYKGLEFLIEASKKIDAKIVIAGDGPEAGNLKKQTLDSGANNIIFTGRVSNNEKFTLINACRAFVFPSHLRSEAFGVSLVEACMFSKPMITCNIGTGTSFINIDGETGFVIPPACPGELEKKINIFANDEELSRKMGTAARDRYEKYFSANIMGKSYADEYISLM